MNLFQRFWNKVDKTEDCWNWTASKTIDGYGTFRIHEKIYKAHRLSYKWSTGIDPKEFLVCHKCDNPSCVRPSHLFLGTIQDNNADRNKKQRQAKGDRSGSRTRPESRPRGQQFSSAKLTEDIVRWIRLEYPKGHFSQRTLAHRFNVSKGVIQNVIEYKTWKHVK